MQYLILQYTKILEICMAENYIFVSTYSREMCSLSSQLMLNLNTEDLGVYHNGEVECLGLCHLARLHAQQVNTVHT